MLNRNVFGYVGQIDEADQMLNTDTCYRSQLIVQVVYYKGGRLDDRRMWAKRAPSKVIC